ncbi:hypothetical protein RHMOL_Rhmol11G0175000 [Rhododendron molle]|uniref:Uncharacterized protein n=1 Tax=Rhododendron molle TaxID=49168 RepID=A0ACC0LUE8_RHOML|nr:hypothetical protein RHMOL_Rhmol11G0175000 [Rhododendron molle]
MMVRWSDGSEDGIVEKGVPWWMRSGGGVDGGNRGRVVALAMTIGVGMSNTLVLIDAYVKIEGKEKWHNKDRATTKGKENEQPRKTGIRLDWMRRLRIALGAARGLQYLHELANPPIIHRDIKSSNILLDESLNAKVSDFGLSRPMGDDAEKSHITTQVTGTMGYMDPEYYMTQQLTEKNDVYSFGVVLLELVTARQPIEEGKYIVREVRQRMKSDQVLYSLDEILDLAILAPTPKGLEQFMDLAMRCVEEEGARRPTMGAVMKEIENVMQIAGLNPKC